MQLGYSGDRYAEFSTDIKTETLISQRIKAFTYFGGYTNSILYDNMKQVVLYRKARQPGPDSTLFSWTSLSSTAYSPDCDIRTGRRQRGKIENTIKFIRNNFWKGMAFTSVADANSQLL